MAPLALLALTAWTFLAWSCGRDFGRGERGHCADAGERLSRGQHRKLRTLRGRGEG